MFIEFLFFREERRVREREKERARGEIGCLWYAPNEIELTTILVYKTTLQLTEPPT